MLFLPPTTGTGLGGRKVYMDNGHDWGVFAWDNGGGRRRSPSSTREDFNFVYVCYL